MYAEEATKYKLSDLPEVIEIFDKSFVLAGALVFIHPIMANDIGHYICASKVNNSWEFYDDLMDKPEYVR